MKKAQITNFIMLGIVLLIMVGVYFFLKSTILEKIEPHKIIPPDFIEVNDFVEQCLFDTASESVKIIGQQGGYIKLPNNIITSRSYINLVPGGMIRVPYWQIMRQNQNPTLAQMEIEMNNYIKENLNQCLNKFESFENKFNITSGDLEVKTTIGEQNVLVNIYHPLLINRLDKNQYAELNDFTARLDVKLKQVYDLAKLIHKSENENFFLEQTTIDLMVLDQRIPFTDLTIDCDKQKWTKSKILQDTKELIYHNMPRIRFEGTNYYDFQSREKYESIHYLWDLDGDYKNFDVGLNYDLSWPMEMVIRPSDGDELLSNVGQGLKEYMDILCFNIYHFTYDLEYPVLFTIRDPNSLSGTGFEFNFILPVYIDHNKPSRDSFDFRDYRAPIFDYSFCEEKTSMKYNFKAVDMRSGFEIKDVNLSFDCVTKRCNLGKTDLLDLNFKLETELPSECTGGFIITDHPDYLESKKAIYLDEIHPDEIINIPIRELKILDYEVFKHGPDNLLFEFEIPEDQNVIINLKENITGTSSVYSFPKIDDEEKIKLLYDDVTYDLEILLLNQEENLIGGYKTEWNVTYDELADSNKIKFHVFEKLPHPSNFAEQQQLALSINNNEFNLSLDPTLIFEQNT